MGEGILGVRGAWVGGLTVPMASGTTDPSRCGRPGCLGNGGNLWAVAALARGGRTWRCCLLGRVPICIATRRLLTVSSPETRAGSMFAGTLLVSSSPTRIFPRRCLQCL